MEQNDENSIDFGDNNKTIQFFILQKIKGTERIKSIEIF
jgi:hypothetical protein